MDSPRYALGTPVWILARPGDAPVAGVTTREQTSAHSIHAAGEAAIGPFHAGASVVWSPEQIRPR